MKPGVGATIVFALFNSSSRQHIFLTLNSGTWSLAPSSLAIAFLSPLPSSPRSSHQSLLTAGYPSTLSHTFILQAHLFHKYSQPLQPKLSGSNIDTWQICSLSWIDSTLNAQQIFNVGDLSYKHCKAQATPLKLSPLGQDESRYTVTYLGGCPLSHILTLCTPDRSIWSENQRKPWIAIVWSVQTKSCRLWVASIIPLMKTIIPVAALIAS